VTHLAHRPRIHSDDDMVIALDSAESLGAAARRVGCTIQAFYGRAKVSPTVREALERRRARGHIPGRKRTPTSESKAQIIERVRVGRTDVSAFAEAPTTLERDVANLLRIQQSRPLAPPGRRTA